jgi:hypothetical protein
MTAPLVKPAVGPSLLLVEGGITFIAVAIAMCIARGNKRSFIVASRTFAAVARRKGLSVLAVGCAAFAIRALLLPILPVPKPFITDDFSFLLAAETFASGRLTNPTHPMWIHFESLQITHLPTYMSMYFPAQGMLLAAGKLIAGSPWVGVLFGMACMCAAFCWMFQAWLPSRWALFGGALAILHLGLFSYWINSYTGGGVPATGGALVMGALPRLWRKFRTRDFFWMSIGMALLANSRPYEGLLICVPAVALLFWKMRQVPHPGLKVLVKRSAPAIVLLTMTLGFMGYYNHRVFGSVFTPPYKVDREAYAVAPYFLFQQARPEPTYRHRAIRDFYAGWELKWYMKSRSLTGFLGMNAVKLLSMQLFYLGFALLPPLIMLPRALKDRRMRPLVLTGAFFLTGLAIETWWIPHYMAPFAAVFYTLLLQSMRHLRMLRVDGRRTGEALMRAIPAICFVICVLRLGAEPLHLGLLPDTESSTAWIGTRAIGLDRDRIQSNLNHQPGKHLVLVRYSPEHQVVDEWVYNGADIDGSKVVWARDMDPQNNAELFSYFADRKVWLVEPDLPQPMASAYPINNSRNLLASTSSAGDGFAPPERKIPSKRTQ